MSGRETIPMSKYVPYLYGTLASLALLLVFLIYDPVKLFGPNRNGSGLALVAFSLNFISLAAVLALAIPSVRRTLWTPGLRTAVILSLVTLVAYIIWCTDLLIGLFSATDL